MARALLTLLVLLLPLALPTGAATSHMHLDYDVLDALDDARAYPDVRLSQTDISRFTMTVEGDEVVQTVHVVGPWPENYYWVEIRNSFGGSESLTLKVERMNSSGSNSRPTDYNSSHAQTLDPARMGQRVPFQFERTDTTMTFRWPASAIPASANCVTPTVRTLSWTTAQRVDQVDDKLEVRPDPCVSRGARMEGLDGSCPAADRDVIAVGKIDDARGDVVERQGFGGIPHDNATLDILSVETRVEDGWVVQTVLLAEASPRDAIQLSIENQYRGNASQFERGPYLHVSLFETGASGGITGEDELGAFHVRATRAEPAGWELRWCAAILPEDAECHSITVRASMNNDRYSDSVRPATEQCPPLADGSPSGDDGTGADDAQQTDGSSGGGSEEMDGANETPGVGLAALVAVALAAVAIRRRG